MINTKHCSVRNYKDIEQKLNGMQPTLLTKLHHIISTKQIAHMEEN